MTHPAPTGVAVVGSGVAGLTAAYLLRHRGVTLFEADPRLGGHAHTHHVEEPGGGAVDVDSGVIVHNTRTYPNLLRLFAELGVATQPTEMSMSVTCDGCGLAYAGGKGARGILADPRTVARPAFLRMLVEVMRFHRRAAALLAADSDDRSLRDFAADNRFSAYFVDHFLVPVVACVWSTSPGEALDYPARYLFTFLDNHGMLSVSGSPQWRTVVGGSARYVERVAAAVDAAPAGSVRPAAPVRSVTRHDDAVEVRTDDDRVSRHAAVVVATHPDAALGLLADPTRAEKDVLGALRATTNRTVLHHDDSLLPARPAVRASWNYRMGRCGGGDGPVVVSYDMNRLQRLDTATPYVVTLGGADRVDPGRVVATMDYEHPLYTADTAGARARVAGLTNGRTAYAGAWTGWGFHEDGCRSGVEAAAALGVGWS
jgi:uncharacterized protein